jgi:ribosomal protein L40E
MKFTKKINEMTTSAINTMKNSAESFKLEGKIAGEEKKIRELTTDIGNLTLLRLDAGEQMNPEIMERYAAIEVARKEISEATEEMPVTKIVCPVCGARTAPEMHYCGVCGTVLEV